MKLCREKFSFVIKQKNPSISPDEIIYPIPVELSLDKVKMNLKGHTRHSDKLCLSYQANFPLGEVLRQTVHEIIAGHRSLSGTISRVTDRIRLLLVTMTGWFSNFNSLP